MMINRKKLYEVIDTSQGIFYYLQAYDVPWKDENIDDVLDAEYMGNISGNRYISPLVKSLLGTDEMLPSADMMRLAKVLYTINGKRWGKLWETMGFEYNPIENYHMVENMTDDNTVTEYGKTDTHTPNTTETDTTELQGFNSSSYVPSERYTSAKTGYETYTGSGQDETTRNYELERSGNIGVTTSQQMIESERNLWMWNFFHDVVFPDLNKILTLSVY